MSTSTGPGGCTRRLDEAAPRVEVGAARTPTVESTTFWGRISFSDTALPSLGGYTFDVRPIAQNQPDVLSTDLPTTVKVHVRLGLAPLTHRGNVVNVAGFVAIDPLITDRYADVRTSVISPLRVGLRLVTPDTATRSDARVNQSCMRVAGLASIPVAVTLVYRRPSAALAAASASVPANKTRSGEPPPTAS